MTFLLLTMHDSEHHISLTQDVRDVHMTRMGATVNDSIHIEIQMVKLRQQGRVRDNLIDLGIAFTDPSVKLTCK
jgi:hypothetical protein